MTADSAQLSFSPSGLLVLNLALAFIVFSVSLYLRREEVEIVRREPRAVAAGLFGQWLWLPLMTLALIWLLRPHPGIAAGMLLVAACPGGSVSAYYTLVARGNVVLSIGLTTVATIAAVVATPMIFGLGARLLPAPPEAVLSVAFLDMLELLALVILLPLALALLLRWRAPAFVERIRGGCRRAAGLLLMVVIVGALIGNRGVLDLGMAPVLGIVVLHNALAFAGGYLIARAMRLGDRETRTVALETGVQNAGLGLVLVFNFFGGDGAMAVVAGTWGVWHLIAGFGLARYWAPRPLLR